MKKLMLTVLTVLSCGVVYALPVGNPSDPALYTNGLCWSGSSCCDPCTSCMDWCDMFSVRLGFYGDYVYNRHLQTRNGFRTNSDINDTEIYTNAGLVVLNICDWIDLFGTFGATDMKITTNVHSFLNAGALMAPTLVQIDFRTCFSWSVGGRAIAWECGCFDIGVEGQYFRTEGKFDSFLHYAAGSMTYFNTNDTAIWEEWQAGIAASYTITTGCPGASFVPYIGLKWAGGRMDFGDFSFLFQGVSNSDIEFYKLQPQKSWGYAVGITATVCDAIGVTVEGRFADEKAIHVNGQFRF